MTRAEEAKELCRLFIDGLNSRRSSGADPADICAAAMMAVMDARDAANDHGPDSDLISLFALAEQDADLAWQNDGVRVNKATLRRALLIVDRVAKAHGLSALEVRSESRTASLCKVRFEAMAACRDVTPAIPWKTIAVAVDRDHTVVIYGAKRWRTMVAGEAQKVAA